MKRHVFPNGIPSLSKQALSIWAKSVYRDPLDKRYLQLWQHMADTESIAELLWRHFVADDVKAMLAEDFGDEEDARNVLLFCAAVHDVGKASPAFEVQVTEFADKVRETGLPISQEIAHDAMRSQYRHELVGSWTIEDWAQHNGIAVKSKTLMSGISAIICGHHGTSLTEGKQQLRTHYRYQDFAGNGQWLQIRFELLDWAAQSLNFHATLDRLQNRPIRRRSQLILTSLITVPDWMASDTRLFALNESILDEYSFNPYARAIRAWKLLSLPEPWNIQTAGQDADNMFAQQFEIPNAKLRPVQREAVRLAETMPKPGLMIIEANMGEGKTEAALLSAEILASRFHCGGVYYALPTQATVNAMFTRILEWIGHLPSSDRRMLASIFLAHGKRELNDDYERLREQWFDDGHGLDSAVFQTSSEGSVGQDEREDGKETVDKEYTTMQAVVNSWLTGRKRGNLSDFVVGTIDQVLMAGLKSKHVVLRHLALAGKVVILDEIHSNTAYMNVYMETVLAWLGAYGVPVIMLSATLPQSRRRAFLEAYRSGANAINTVEPITDDASSERSTQKSRFPKRRVRAHAMASTASSAVAVSDEKRQTDKLDLRYPLISVSTANSIYDSSPAPSGRSSRITVSLIDDSDEALLSLLQKVLCGGGCAVVIRNTVKRAQATYDLLSKALDVPVTLSHSRFLAFDRAHNDNNLLLQYGKRGSAEQRQGVVVATQVVEQSLDVDFDIMVTDIAPIDLILQRAGRLHRHHRGDGESQRPEILRNPRLIITGVEQYSDSKPPEFAQGLDSVYQRYWLMRSLSVLNVKLGKDTLLSLPDDIPTLVQTVYGETMICSDCWQDGDLGERKAYENMRQTINRSEDAANQLRIFRPDYSRNPFELGKWLENNVPDPDTPGSSKQRLVAHGVRESDDSIEVIVLQQDSYGNLQLPSWGDFAESSPLPTGMNSRLTRQQVRDILSCTISLGSSSLHYLDIDQVIKSFELATPEQWFIYMSQNRELDGQLLVVLDESGCARYSIPESNGKESIMKTLSFHYSMEKGWETDVE